MPAAVRRWGAPAALFLLVILILLLGKSVLFPSRHAPYSLPPGYADDISRLNATHVAELWDIPAEPAAAEEQLRRLLARAQAQRLPVAIAGARHSMGGHTIAPEGIVINMLPFRHMKVDEAEMRLHVGAGARWSEIVPQLDARGLSVAVMQSNNDFTVGGSLSVNCHGWEPNRPPIASTVESIRVMKADGTVVRCSRTENADLFALVLGGYGLFGVILDADLCVVANERYRLEGVTFPAEQLVASFAGHVQPPGDVGMVYGRLCVAPGAATFLREGYWMIFRRAPCPPPEIPSLKGAGVFKHFWDVQTAHAGDKASALTNWEAEKTASRELSGQIFSRNQLLNEPATAFGQQRGDLTYILQEYVVPPDQFSPFLEALRGIIPRHQGMLLGTVVRKVCRDPDTLLRYADQDMFTLALMFLQPRTAEGDAAMQVMTREMIDAVLNCRGRYYLPYRLHAAKDQLDRAYPQFCTWLEQKRRHDPAAIFQNRFFFQYRDQ
jgi:FAD/FMN-containing dehydrogenase